MIRFVELKQSLWPNGAGRKADILTGEGWVVAFAWLERDAPFSDYTGFARTITLVDGAGFRLRFTPETSADLLIDTRYVPTEFDGGWPTHCEILGPCVVLNAYSRRAGYQQTVEIVRTPCTIDPAGSVATVAVMLDGHWPVGIGRLDSLEVTGAIEIPSGGEVAIVRMTQLR